MKKLSVLSLAIVLGLSVLPQASAAGQFSKPNNNGGRGDQVCTYKDINFQGAEQCYRAGDEIGDLGGQKNSISSIRIFGRASVTVYDNSSFRGHAADFSSDVP